MTKNKVIIFFPVGIGDSLMFTPIINSIKKKAELLENYDIDALVMNPATNEILEKFDFFNKINLINFLTQPLLSSIKEIIKLRKNNYDKSILIFPANLYKYQIIHYLLGAKERYSHNYIKTSFVDLYWLSNNRTSENRKLHSTDENYNLLDIVFKNDVKINRNYEMSILLDNPSIKYAENYLLNLNNDTIVNYIGLHTGSDTFKNLEYKRWNKDYFLELIKKIDKNYKKEFHFLLFGIGDELDINNYIKNKFIQKNITVIKETSYIESAALISMCNFFISNDSGLMHTAAALKIPVLSIFGPTNELYTKPIEGKNIISTLKNCSCRPCFEYSKFHLVCNEEKKYRCMTELTPEIVFNDFKKLYNKNNK